MMGAASVAWDAFMTAVLVVLALSVLGMIGIYLAVLRWAYRSSERGQADEERKKGGA